MLKNKKVALYCRVACVDDSAIKKQEDALRNFASDKGYDNLSAYADNGASGLKYDRPALSRLNADIESGYVDTLIVRSVDRIGRDAKKTQDWIDNIRSKGVSLVIAYG